MLVKNLEMDHWVLFDTLTPEQMSRLKRVIVKKVEGENASFDEMLGEETAKLDKSDA